MKRSLSGWRKEAALLFPSARFDEPMSRRTTFGIGGPADCYAEPRAERELQALVRFARGRGLPVFVLGWGSKLLVADAGVRGLVVRLRGAFEECAFPPGGLARAGAGLRLPALVSLAARRGLSGLEPLAGIPGTVGGALVMNAGTREGAIGALVRRVRALDPATGRPRDIPRRSLRFGYRSSNLSRVVVLGCDLQLKARGKDGIIDEIRAHQRRRSLTQPIHTHNIGSIFRNPPGMAAAKLIEDCGLKGATCGGARVSPMHANFIENHAGASAADVLELVRRIRAAVRSASGVELDLEMRIIGDA